MKQQAYTLVELLVALAVLVILTGLAAPGLSDLYQAQQRLTAARELANGIRSARVAAITRRQDVIIQAIDNDWSNGWRIIAGHNPLDPDDPLLVERALDGQVRITGNTKVARQLRFTPLGGLRAAANGTLHVCLKDQPVSHYRVIVAVTGRVRVEEQKITEQRCG